LLRKLALDSFSLALKFTDYKNVNLNMNLKNFAIGLLVILLLTSNGYWAANWIGSSLDVESYDMTIWSLQAKTEEDLRLLNKLAAKLEKSELRRLLENTHTDDLWLEGDNLNTINFEFWYDRETFIEVIRQSKIRPGEKG